MQDGGHGGHDGHQPGASFGNPGGMHGGHLAHGGDGHSGGRAMKDAVNFSHNHGSGDRAHFTRNPTSQAHASQHPGNEVGALDRQGDNQSKVPPPITFDQAEAACQEPTRTLTVHVVNHGFYNHRANFARRAHELKMIRQDRRVPNMDGATEHVKKGSDKCPSGISTWHAWLRDFDPDQMPDGWQKDFTGETFLYKEWWGIAKWNAKIKRWEFDREAHTAVEVAWVIWRFDQTGAFETKLTLRVVSDLIFFPPAQMYGYKISYFRSHQAAAIKLAKEEFAALVAAKPDPMQQLLLSLYPNSAATHPEGAYPASKDDEAELATEGLEADIMEDQNTASDSSGAILGGATAPPDTPVQPDSSFDGNGASDLAFANHSGSDIASVLPDTSAVASRVTAPAPTQPTEPRFVTVTVRLPLHQD